jgi:hypothetical protein
MTMDRLIHDIIDKGYAVLAGLMVLTVIGIVAYWAMITLPVAALTLVFLVSTTVFSFLGLVVLTVWWFIWQWRRGK